MTLAVAGATTATSASCASRTCSTSPGLLPQRRCSTGLPVSAAKVSAPTKRVADGVITTVTAAPARVSSAGEMRGLVRGDAAR